MSRISPSNQPSSGIYNHRNINSIPHGRNVNNNGQSGSGMFSNNHRGGWLCVRNNGITGGLFLNQIYNIPNNQLSENGVDISDVTRYFNYCEWNRLKIQTRNRISIYTNRL